MSAIFKHFEAINNELNVLNFLNGLNRDGDSLQTFNPFKSFKP